MEENKFCPHCGTQVEEGASFCPHCGAKLNGESNTYSGSYESASGQSNYDFSGTSGQFNQNGNSAENSQMQSYSLMTLIFGLLALVLGGVIWGIVALVLSRRADPKDGKTKAGKIMAIIGIIWWVIAITLMIVIVIANSAQPA